MTPSRPIVASGLSGAGAAFGVALSVICSLPRKTPKSSSVPAPPDEPLQGVEGADPLAVDRLDPVADLEAGRRGRAARLDERNPRRQSRAGNADAADVVLLAEGDERGILGLDRYRPAVAVSVDDEIERLSDAGSDQQFDLAVAVDRHGR